MSATDLPEWVGEVQTVAALGCLPAGLFGVLALALAGLARRVVPPDLHAYQVVPMEAGVALTTIALTFTALAWVRWSRRAT